MMLQLTINLELMNLDSAYKHYFNPKILKEFSEQLVQPHKHKKSDLANEHNYGTNYVCWMKYHCI